MRGPDQHVWAQHEVPLDAQAGTPGLEMKFHGSLWETNTFVPEIAIQCHREVKTVPFGNSIQHLGTLSRMLGPRRQCHDRPRLALLRFPIQCPKLRVGNSQTVPIEAQTRDSHTVPMGDQTSHLGFPYTVPLYHCITNLNIILDTKGGSRI